MKYTKTSVYIQVICLLQTNDFILQNVLKGKKISNGKSLVTLCVSKVVSMVSLPWSASSTKRGAGRGPWVWCISQSSCDRCRLCPCSTAVTTRPTRTHLYKLHRDPGLLLAASLPQPLIRHLGRCLQVDDEVEGQPDAGVHPVVPGHQHLQLRPAQAALPPRVLQEAEPVALHTALQDLHRAASGSLQKLQSCQLHITLERKQPPAGEERYTYIHYNIKTDH